MASDKVTILTDGTFEQTINAGKPVLINVAGLRILDEIALTVAPPLMAVPRDLRLELAEWLELKAAHPARACRRSATRIARLLAISRRRAFNRSTAHATHAARTTCTACTTRRPKAPFALGNGPARPIAEHPIGARAYAHLASAHRPGITATIHSITARNEHRVSVAARAGAKPN